MIVLMMLNKAYYINVYAIKDYPEEKNTHINIAILLNKLLYIHI